MDISESGSTSVLLGLGQIAIPVSSMQNSKRFYTEVMGMPLLFDAGPLTFVTVGAVRVMLSEETKPFEVSSILLYFRVEDIEHYCKQLQERGARLLEAPHVVARMPDHDLWIAFTTDPDGHRLGIMCERRNAAATS